MAKPSLPEPLPAEPVEPVLPVDPVLPVSPPEPEPPYHSSWSILKPVAVTLESLVKRTLRVSPVTSAEVKAPLLPV